MEALSDDKVAKIKKFSKEYIAKVLHKIEKSGKRSHRHSDRSNTNNTPSTSTAVGTPRSHDDGGDMLEQMTVEEAMGLDPDEDDAEDSDGGGHDGDENGSEPEAGSDGGACHGTGGVLPSNGHFSGEDVRDDDGMSIDNSASLRTAVQVPLPSPPHSLSANGLVDGMG